MKKTLFLCSLLYTGLLFGQDTTIQSLQKEASKTIKKDSADTTHWIWKKGGLYSLTVSQSSLSNWAAGGEDFSLTLTTMLNLFAFYKKNKHHWDNTLDINYAMVRTTSQGSRKNDDRIDLLSRYGYAISSDWNIAAQLDFRTQAFRGYDYGDDDERTFISDFLSPAYLTLSLGMEYKPNDNFSVFISPVSSRRTIMKDDSLAAKGLYGVSPGKHYRDEFGAFLSANYLKKFSETLSYKGRLDLFSNYRHNPQNVDVYMTNYLVVKLWKALSLTWSVDLIYDDDVRLFGPDKTSARTQFKSQVGLGLAVDF